MLNRLASIYETSSCAISHIWPPIIDPGELALSRLQVHHSDQGAKRQPRMGSSGGIHIIGLAAGGSATVEPRTIPARHHGPGLDRLANPYSDNTYRSLEVGYHQERKQRPSQNRQG